jgi:hypothetical protein
MSWNRGPCGRGAALAGLAVIIILALAAPAEADSQVLRLNWPSQQSRDWAVTEIGLTETQISLTIQVRNRRSLLGDRVFVMPPGRPLSHYIQEKATGRRHYLAGSQGLAVYPDYQRLPLGGSISYKLFFMRIPLATFSLMAGEPSLRSTVNAIFHDYLDLDLGKLEKDFKSADRPPPRPDHVWSQPPAPPAKPEAQSAPPAIAGKPAPPQEPLKSFDNPKRQETEP